MTAFSTQYNHQPEGLSNDIGHWVRFFLQAVVETAESGKKTFQRILALRQELDAEILKLGRRAENGQRLILYLYGTPTITVNKTMELLAIKYVPANSLIAILVNMGILQEITGFQRNRIFLLRRYIKVLKRINNHCVKTVT